MYISKRLRLCKRRLNEIKYVNSVYKGTFQESRIDLELLSKSLNNSKFYKKQPQMLVVTNTNGVKMIIFNSGKFRIMGNFIPTLRNANNEIKKFKMKSIQTQLSCQTSTVVTRLNKKNINLSRLFSHLQSLYQNKYIGHCELESFPAIALKIWDPLHVNIFASGKIVITGVGCCNFCKCMYIKQYLCNCINMIF